MIPRIVFFMLIICFQAKKVDFHIIKIYLSYEHHYLLVLILFKQHFIKTEEKMKPVILPITVITLFLASLAFAAPVANNLLPVMVKLPGANGSGEKGFREVRVPLNNKPVPVPWTHQAREASIDVEGVRCVAYAFTQGKELMGGFEKGQDGEYPDSIHPIGELQCRKDPCAGKRQRFCDVYEKMYGWRHHCCP